MKNHRLLAVSSLFLAATISAGVAGRAVANAEVDAGTVPSRLETLVGNRDASKDHFDAKCHFLEAGKIKLSEEIDYRRLSKVKARRIIPKNKEKRGMQFLLLIYENEKRFASGFDPAEMQEYETFGQQHANAIKGGNALQPTTEAQTVRVRNGKALTTDGPFAETKEQLGGFYLVEAPDKAAAATMATKIPGARFGCVEVRPIMTFS